MANILKVLIAPTDSEFSKGLMQYTPLYNKSNFK